MIDNAAIYIRFHRIIDGGDIGDDGFDAHLLLDNKEHDRNIS